jgi:ATP-dependent Clp protease protease subunit
MAWERLQSALNAALADDQRTENILRERTSLPDDILSAKRLRDVHILPNDALQWGLVQSVREFTLPKGTEILQI